MKRARRPFKGILYAGIMLTNQGPKVLEFNVRFGDPETQVLMMRLRSDLLTALEATVDERLDEITLEWDARPSVTIVMASEGYPGTYERDREIDHLDKAAKLDDVQVFHAGTTIRQDAQHLREPRVMTDGGRVLTVTAIGSTLAQAQARAYNAVRTIHYPGAWYRNDIAGKVSRDDDEAKAAKGATTTTTELT
jgi:phosphoribosylamine--glycine ligase